MLLLSEIMIANQQFNSFEELEDAIKTISQGGERFFRMDVKPQYFDTPNDWEERLEVAFSSLGR